MTIRPGVTSPSRPSAPPVRSPVLTSVLAEPELDRSSRRPPHHRIADTVALIREHTDSIERGVRVGGPGQSVVSYLVSTPGFVARFLESAREPGQNADLEALANLAFDGFWPADGPSTGPDDWLDVLGQVFVARRVVEECARRLDRSGLVGLIDREAWFETDRIRLAIESARPLAAAGLERAVRSKMNGPDMKALLIKFERSRP